MNRCEECEEVAKLVPYDDQMICKTCLREMVSRLEDALWKTREYLESFDKWAK